MFLKQNKVGQVKDTGSSRPQSASINYQSGYNANKQSINSGQINADFARESQLNAPENLSNDGKRGMEDLQRSLTANSVAQNQRGYDAQNAQQGMVDMANRSQLTQQGAANQAQIYSDINSRAADQIGLAAKIKEANIRNNYVIANKFNSKLQQLLNG